MKRPQHVLDFRNYKMDGCAWPLFLVQLLDQSKPTAPHAKSLFSKLLKETEIGIIGEKAWFSKIFGTLSGIQSV